MKPSAEAVLGALRAHPEGITQMDALLRLGLGDSLAQRVNELRAEGHDVRTAYETTDRGQRVARYRLSAPVGWGSPVGRVRRCPSCRLDHAVGTACAPRGAFAR